MGSWSEKFSVNIEVIDNQHKELFDILDSCYELLLKNHDDDKYDKIIAILEQLKDYTIYHFKTEEEFMRKNRYSKFLSHKFAHDSFMEQINCFDIYSIDIDQKQYINNILDVVSNWIKVHILETDKNIHKYLNL
ncbi:bacteriohemerythrin [Clostridium sp.]|uniref:bacteriohemerythrin n=1 Tax=Clostridium sp. TaxID=1506 RepID=UPI0025B7B30B|nr:bacteriohemerythrin [Clostridium sp.]